ncbi:hypothetical protein PFBG_00672 [Plasmodium falciparum 7G8]|uniref:Uncharacterized protein n=1 Tax=Plasmodium falciparum (isolate 7G8) TaxID=57266 RepID=W7FLH3_PLAF8|nr:hypothetical protein PFBG_00672 [Plasmodium falciparum 7G8]
MYVCIFMFIFLGIHLFNNFLFSHKDIYIYIYIYIQTFLSYYKKCTRKKYICLYLSL